MIIATVGSALLHPQYHFTAMYSVSLIALNRSDKMLLKYTLTFVYSVLKAQSSDIVSHILLK